MLGNQLNKSKEEDYSKMYIIADGTYQGGSAVFQVVEKEPDGEFDGQVVQGWYRAKRLSDGREFRLAPDHRLLAEIPAKFLGSKAVSNDSSR